jgi:hypothetical protein
VPERGWGGRVKAKKKRRKEKGVNKGRRKK